MNNKKTKFIFVMGGVLSGLGKGIATSSIAKLLQSRGFKVTAMKIDPYINVDAGTMNPTEHGEVFVTKDGLETDQDIGNYERFLDLELDADNYMTQGSVWQTVINKERNLEYGGKCVEPVPHIPAEVIRRIKKLANKSKTDFVMIDIGGTVGEYQNFIFLEAARMMKLKMPNQVMSIMVSYLPIPSKIGEMKTKPTQTAVKTLNSAGIQPDFILARSERPLDHKRKEKISVFCNVAIEDVISSPDVDSIYQVPLVYRQQNLDKRILFKFNMKANNRDLRDWQKKLLQVPKIARKKITIGLVGKYFSTGSFTLSDSYISVIESLRYAAWQHKVKIDFIWVDSESIEKGKTELSQLNNFDGVVVPGGFGKRGVEGIIKSIEYVRKNKIPYFGLCYGMQLACIEFARNVLKLKNANTTEIDKQTTDPIIDLMIEQKQNIKDFRYGGSMRLGDYNCQLLPKSNAFIAYNAKKVIERHRHRYEFNNKYRSKFIKAGLLVSGINKQRDLVEIIELNNHPFFMGVQFHPEFKSRPLRPHPLFLQFIKVALKNNETKSKS
jgi:CTP synthase